MKNQVNFKYVSERVNEYVNPNSTATLNGDGELEKSTDIPEIGSVEERNEVPDEFRSISAEGRAASAVPPTTALLEPVVTEGLSLPTPQLPVGNTSPSSESETIRLNDIEIPDGHRPPNGAKVKAMVGSITEVGLLHRIAVRQKNPLTGKYLLGPGGYRYAAVRMLGWTEIECNVIEDDDLICELAEIDENLIRNDLNFLEIGDYAIRRNKILEAKGLRAKRGDNQHTRRGHARTTASIAEEIGIPKRSLQENMQLARSLSQKAKDAVRKYDLPKEAAWVFCKWSTEVQDMFVDKLVAKISKYPGGEDNVMRLLKEMLNTEKRLNKEKRAAERAESTQLDKLGGEAKTKSKRLPVDIASALATTEHSELQTNKPKMLSVLPNGEKFQRRHKKKMATVQAAAECGAAENWRYVKYVASNGVPAVQQAVAGDELIANLGARIAEHPREEQQVLLDQELSELASNAENYLKEMEKYIAGIDGMINFGDRCKFDGIACGESEMMGKIFTRHEVLLEKLERVENIYWQNQHCLQNRFNDPRGNYFKQMKSIYQGTFDYEYLCTNIKKLKSAPKELQSKMELVEASADLVAGVGDRNALIPLFDKICVEAKNLAAFCCMMKEKLIRDCEEDDVIKTSECSSIEEVFATSHNDDTTNDDGQINAVTVAENGAIVTVTSEPPKQTVTKSKPQKTTKQAVPKSELQKPPKQTVSKSKPQKTPIQPTELA